jgi:hypothetical protein
MTKCTRKNKPVFCKGGKANNCPDFGIVDGKKPVRCTNCVHEYMNSWVGDGEK